MEKQKTLVPWFQRGDIGGMTYSITNNIVNYLIVIATLSGVLDWPDKIVYGYVIPGMSIGLLCSGVYYAYMGRRLSKKEGRADVTALPSGVSTPAMFVMLYGVIMPLHYALNDAELAWSAAVAACFIGGAVEFLGGFIGPWMKKKLPRAALLGTVAGIGFIRRSADRTSDFVCGNGRYFWRLFISKADSSACRCDCGWDHLCILPGKNNRRFQRNRFLYSESC